MSPGGSQSRKQQLSNPAQHSLLSRDLVYSLHWGEQLPRPEAKASVLIRKESGTTQNAEKQDRLLIWKQLPILYMLGCGCDSVSKYLPCKHEDPRLGPQLPVRTLQRGGACLRSQYWGERQDPLGLLASQPSQTRELQGKTQDVDL